MASLADCLRRLGMSKAYNQDRLPVETTDRLTRLEERRFKQLTRSGIPETQARQEAGLYALDQFRPTFEENQRLIAARRAELAAPPVTEAVATTPQTAPESPALETQTPQSSAEPTPTETAPQASVEEPVLPLEQRKGLIQKPYAERLQEGGLTNQQLNLTEPEAVVVDKASTEAANIVSRNLGIVDSTGAPDQNSIFWTAAKEEAEIRIRGGIRSKGRSFLNVKGQKGGLSVGSIASTVTSEIGRTREFNERASSLDAPLDDDTHTALDNLISAGDVASIDSTPELREFRVKIAAEVAAEEAVQNAALKDTDFQGTLTPVELKLAQMANATSDAQRDQLWSEAEVLAKQGDSNADADEVIAEAEETLLTKILSYGKDNQTTRRQESPAQESAEAERTAPAPTGQAETPAGLPTLGETQAQRDDPELPVFAERAATPEGGESLGPGAASAEEPLAKYKERKFGKRFVEDERIAQEVRDATGNRYYEPIPNITTAEEAKKLVDERGLGESLKIIRDETNNLSFAIRNTMGQIAIQRMNEAVQGLRNNGSPLAMAQADQLVNETADLAEWAMDYGTRLGQGVQSFAMWQRLTPEGQLAAYKKSRNKAKQRFKDRRPGEVEGIEETVNQINQTELPEAIQKARSKTKRGIPANSGDIWSRYVESLSEAMDATVGLTINPTESQKGLLQNFASNVQRLFTDKIPKPERKQAAQQSAVARVREQLSNAQEISNAWAEAREQVLSGLEGEARAKAEALIPPTLEAPFTQGDLRKVMRETGLFDPRKLAKLWGEEKNRAIEGLVQVLTEDQPVEATRLAEAKEWIRLYSNELIDAEKKTLTEAVNRMNAARETSERMGQDGSLWDRYADMAADSLLQKVRKKTGPDASPALQDFTQRLTSELRGRLQSEGRPIQDTPRDNLATLKEALANQEKYQDVWDRALAEAETRYADNPEELARIKSVFGSLAAPYSPKTIQEIIRADLEQNDLRLNDIARQHYSQTDAYATKLSDKLVEQLGLTGEQATQLSSDIASELGKLTQIKKKQALQNLAKEGNRTAKQVSSDVQKLIEASNIGVLNDESFFTAAQDRLGLPKFSEEIAKEIRRLTEKIQNSKEGIPKDRATFELTKYLAKQKGFDVTDLPLGVWYGNILSGYNTHLVNVVDTMLNVQSELTGQALLNPGAAMKMYSAFARGLKEGKADFTLALREGRKAGDMKWAEVPGLMDVADFGVKGGVPISEETAFGRLQKAVAESKLGNVFKFQQSVGRLLQAEDAIMFRAVKEARASILAYNMAKKEGLDGAALDERMQEILGLDRVDDFIKQAKSEGFEGADLNARVLELQEAVRPEDLNLDATAFAQQATYNHDPKGVLGWASRAVEGGFQNLQRTVAETDNPYAKGTAQAAQIFARTVIPFTRIVANVTNRGLNYTPYGYKRALWGYTGEAAPTGEARQQALLRANIGMAGTVALGALNALGVIAIHGAGPSDDEKKKQLQASGWKPYSIKIGDTYVDYRYTPLGLNLAMMGNWLDTDRYEELKNKDSLDRLFYTASRLGSTVFSQTFLSGLATFFDALGESPGKAISALKRMTTSNVGGLILPNAVREVQRWFDPQQYESNNLIQDILRGTPVAALALKPSLNPFGDPITVPRQRFFTQTKEDPAWKIVVEKDFRLPVASRSTRLDPKKPEPLSPEQYYRYHQASGQKLKSRMLENEEFLRSSDKEVAQEWINDASQEIHKEELAKVRAQAGVSTGSKASRQPPTRRN